MLLQSHTLNSESTKIEQGARLVVTKRCDVSLLVTFHLYPIKLSPSWINNSFYSLLMFINTYEG